MYDPKPPKKSVRVVAKPHGYWQRQGRIASYQKGDQDPKGVWRAKKGRTNPHRKHHHNAQQLILEQLLTYTKKVGIALLSLTLGIVLFYVASQVIFVASVPLYDSLIRVFVGAFASVFAVFGAISLWVWGVADPFAKLSQKLWQ